MIIKQPFMYPLKNEERMLHIYLPDNYLNCDDTYPVAYFFDGHNLYKDEDATYGKSWGLEKFLTNYKKEFIVVGIECSHVGHERLDEYCPYDLKESWLGDLKGYGKEARKLLERYKKASRTQIKAFVEEINLGYIQYEEELKQIMAEYEIAVGTEGISAEDALTDYENKLRAAFEEHSSASAENKENAIVKLIEIADEYAQIGMAFRKVEEAPAEPAAEPEEAEPAEEAVAETEETEPAEEAVAEEEAAPAEAPEAEEPAENNIE